MIIFYTKNLDNQNRHFFPTLLKLMSDKKI